MAKKELEWVLVDTIETFRMRYVIQVPKGKKAYALDTITCREGKEFSQEWIGEQIVSHRVISEKDALELYDEDNPSFKSWSKEKKIKAAFTKEGEKGEY
jgi:hypothetical protein